MKTLVTSCAVLSILFSAGSSMAYSPMVQSQTADSTTKTQAQVSTQGIQIAEYYEQHCDCTVYADGSKWCQCW